MMQLASSAAMVCTCILCVCVCVFVCLCVCLLSCVFPMIVDSVFDLQGKVQSLDRITIWIDICITMSG